MLSEDLGALRLLHSSVLLRWCECLLTSCSRCLLSSFLCFLLLSQHLELSNLLLLGFPLLTDALLLLPLLPINHFPLLNLFLGLPEFDLEAPIFLLLELLSCLLLLRTRHRANRRGLVRHSHLFRYS